MFKVNNKNIGVVLVFLLWNIFHIFFTFSPESFQEERKFFQKFEIGAVIYFQKRLKKKKMSHYFSGRLCYSKGNVNLFILRVCSENFHWLMRFFWNLHCGRLQLMKSCNSLVISGKIRYFFELMPKSSGSIFIERKVCYDFLVWVTINCLNKVMKNSMRH